MSLLASMTLEFTADSRNLKTMSRLRLLPGSLAFWLAGAALALAGCSHQVPPRPVPPPEDTPTLPPWYPEKPWSEKSNDEVMFEGKVVFDTARSTLRPESEAVLQKLLTWLNENPDVSRVRLEGHTDSRAGEEYNQGLSERRAIAVADWLVDHGLDHNRILAVAFGETRPLAPNDSATGRQENRRAAFYPAEVSGRRFQDKDPANGGMVLTVLSKEEREAMKKKGTVPTYTPPPLKPEGDIIKPIEGVADKMNRLRGKILADTPPTVDASSGEVKEEEETE